MGHPMPKSAAKSLPSISLRIDLDAEGRIGPGKIVLLEQHSGLRFDIGGRPRDGDVVQAGLGSGRRDQPHLPPTRRRAPDRRQERRRRGADAVRPVAGGALPQDRARRGQRGQQGIEALHSDISRPKKAWVRYSRSHFAALSCEPSVVGRIRLRGRKLSPQFDRGKPHANWLANVGLSPQRDERETIMPSRS